MTEKYKPKLILLESNDAVLDHAGSILKKEGWDVFCEQVSSDALNRLEQSREYLFALFISNFKLPKMEGDDILQKVKSISPLTQRMLLVPSDRVDMLISAVNKGEINACITFPFNDEDLINQAANCLKQFKLALRRQRLKRVTAHQNKQMFKIAQKLKKKDDAYRIQIDGKKNRLSRLTSRTGKTGTGPDTDLCLPNLLLHKKIKPAPDEYKDQFMTLARIIKDGFDQVGACHNFEPVVFNPMDLKTLKTQKEPGNQAGIDPDSPDPVEEILKQAYLLSIPSNTQNSDTLPLEPELTCTEKIDHILDHFFEITLSENRIKAYIKKTSEFKNGFNLPKLSDILGFLREKQISYGIIGDDAIEAWISGSFAGKIMIAEGEDPVHGQDGKIEFFFKTDFTTPGKINEDGSIDFRDKGEIPYAVKGSLLAQKTLPQTGRSGITVSGTPIPVNDPHDPVFFAGPGTTLSEDTLCIHAAVDGQPHFDVLGAVSVNPELVIPGDVDFATGNINFKGNIYVKGMVREGFVVKGINLTAKEVQGATIDLSGDLNVSAGITDSKTFVHGHIHAKYLNHSTVMGFGNLTIQKEIIDSNILLSGSCKNVTGHIFSSRISARLGIEAGKIGTPSSTLNKLEIGADTHIDTLAKDIDKALEALTARSTLLKNAIKKLEKQDQKLYLQISEKAHIQDRSRLEIEELKKALQKTEQSNGKKRVQEIENKIQQLLNQAMATEKELNTIFETQDQIANTIEQLKIQINLIEEKNKTHVLQKKALADFLKKDTPVPVLTVAKAMTMGTLVKGPHASLTLQEDRSRCKIQEISINENGVIFHEIHISDL